MPRFTNVDGSTNPHGLGTVLKWKLGMHDGPRAAPAGPVPVPIVDNEIHVVVVTHNHRDHMDTPTLRKLGPKPVYVVPRGLSRWFLKAGLTRVVEMDWWEERDTQHMDPFESVRAFEALGAQRFVAMHWGTYQLTDEALDEPPKLLRRAWEERNLPDAQRFIPAIGETLRW